jgi:RNA polymerase sigma factor (sigma-70 family)
VQLLSDSLTSGTLLGRIRQVPIDPIAWSEFVRRYSRKILGWCRAWGLQEADSQDVAQTVMLGLLVKLRDFQYDSRSCFRAWLKTVTRHAWSDYLEKQRRAGQPTDDAVGLRRLASLEAREDLTRRMMEAFDEEIVNEALARVQIRVAPRTWAAFHLLAIQGFAGAEAARQLNMKVATVFVARSKVQKMISEEVNRLQASV